MTRLSSPVQAIDEHYDVVVVGSGYGGAIAASRLARAGKRVCVLERGREFEQGDFPDTGPEALEEVQVDAPDARIGNDTALFDFHVSDDLNVLVGCGLGGTSLINANVAIRADPRVFEDSRWPRALRDDIATRMEAGYDRAEEMLNPSPYPETWPELPKLTALERSARAMGLPFFRPRINVTFTRGPNRAGVEQQPCALCGNCISGCNHAAKNTVAMNYLPDARAHGAVIFTRTSVHSVTPSAGAVGRWLVSFTILDAGREQFDAPPMFVTADVVVVAAGSLGSSRILLRSKAAGLHCSDRVGYRFTGNGDVLGFGYNTDVEIDGIGFAAESETGTPVGPCITGVIDARGTPEFEEGMIVEEGSIPGALRLFLPEAFAIASRLVGRDTDGGVNDWLRERRREIGSLIGGAGQGAVSRVQTYLAMTHDDGDGRIVMRGDRVQVVWPEVGRQPIFQQVSDRMDQATAALGGTYVKNPIWSSLFKQDLLTVHPLGGCVMAEDAEHGVVDHKGRVFSGRHGDAVHTGLYVLDGSIVPRSVGVNPLLTISALAERGVELMAEDFGWTIDWESHPPLPETEPVPVGVQFTETMGGPVAFAGEESPLRFILTIYVDDVDQVLDPQRDAQMVGSVVAPALSPHPLTVTEGRFNLFLPDADNPGVKHMRYRMAMTATDGRRWWFEGNKDIRDDGGFDLWKDATTLSVTVYGGDSAEGPVAGMGVLRLGPADFGHQLTTFRAVGGRNLKERLEGLERFLQTFAGSLYETYGGFGKLFRNTISARQR